MGLRWENKNMFPVSLETRALKFDGMALLSLILSISNSDFLKIFP